MFTLREEWVALIGVFDVNTFVGNIRYNME